MVDDDLPRTRDDFPRWIAQRVLSPAATLHHEATTLLADDQTFHHSILNVIANGAVALASIAKKLGRPASNLDPMVRRLVDAGFVVRHDDPMRLQRPTFALADPFLQFTMRYSSRTARCGESDMSAARGKVALPPPPRWAVTRTMSARHL